MSSGSAVTGGSSAGAEGASAAPLGQRLMVHVAENGHSMEFECGGDTPVEAIQRSIELVCGVPPAGQLLLCDNIHLNGANNLAHYNLPRDDREVFLYNKARLQDNALPPAPESIDIPEPSIPPPPRPQDTPLEVSADPALKALVSYEIRFRYDFQVANAFYQSSVVKYEVCRRLLREWQVQERALDMARSNLEQAFRKPSQRYSNYVRSFTQQHRGYVEVLSSFERDCKRLRAVKLHPDLQCEGRRCLLDLMDENILRKLADEYVSSYKNFEVFVSSLKVKFADLKKRVDSLLNAMSSSAWKDLEALIKEHQRVIGDQKSIMQSLSKDVDTSKKLVDDCSRCQLSDSLRPHDAVSAVGRIYEVHEKDNLPSVRKFDRMLTNLLQKCKAKKNETNTLVHVCVKGVKSAQMDIKDMMQNQFILHEEAIDSRDKEYSYLKLLGGLGHAYKACLAEVVRRRHSFKLYTGLAGQLAEKLAVEREAEIRRREVFLRTWCKYIGGEIMASMGLFGTPSQCDVNIMPFDSNLLPIDVDDLERLAPQSLVGSLLKPERSQQNKSQSSDSGTSGNFSNSQQNNLNTDGKMDLQDFFGGCDTVDITGTSILEVENARLKAELASAIAVICTFGATHESFDEGQNDNVLRDARERTVQALSAKDEYANQLQSMLKAKQEQCLSFEKRIQELEEQLANQYIKGHMVSGSKGASDSLLSTFKDNDLDASGGRQTDLRDESSVAMDETSSTSEQPSKQTEGGDEPMLLTLPQEWQWQWQLLVALVAVVFLVATARGSSKKGLRLPPGPMMLPVLGNLHQVGELPHRSLRELARRHGPVMLLRLGTVRTVVVSSAEAAKEVMKTHDVECCSRPASPGPKLLSYDLKNLGFAPYGEYWREMRRLFVVELLSMRRVKAAAYAREQQVAKLVSNLNRLGGKQPVVLNEHIFGLTDGIIGTVAFGNVYGADQFPHKGRFQEVLDEAMEMMASFSAEDFFPGAGGHLVDRITGLLGRRERVFKELDAFFEVIIEQHLDPARPKPDNGGDLVDVLIGLWKEQRNTLCFTKDHVKAIILDTFIGAIDTSSVTMLWAMSELIRKPRVLRKVQDEIRAMVGHNNQLGRRVQEDDVPNLTYLKMVVKETLRLHPPATLLVPRETMQSCQIGGYDVPAKTRVLVNAWAIGRDPASWSADSEEFNPDRFQGSDIDFNGAHFQLLPFGAGRRICPGLAMGVMNVEFTLANLLYCFDWALPEGMTPDKLSMDEAGALIFRRKASLVLVPTPRG